MKTNIFVAVIISTVFTGCVGWFDVTPRLETVVDTVYVPKECPTYTHTLKIDGSKYSNQKEYSETMVVIDLDSFLESLERNKLARQTFNNGVKESNKELKIEAKPETTNFKRIEKRIFVQRICPKYTYKPQIKARKLTDQFKSDTNTTYVVVTLDNMILSMEKHKLSKETYNQHIDIINDKPFTEAMKEKFDGYVEIAVDKINETAKAIKEKAIDIAKDEAVDYAKEKTFGKSE